MVKVWIFSLLLGLQSYQQQSAFYSKSTILVSLACGIVIFSMIIVSMLPAFETMASLMQKAQINTAYTKAIIKTLGVCYVTQLASDSCKDAGQSAIASKVELSGKVFIVIISLPLFEDLIDIAFSLINMNL